MSDKPKGDFTPGANLSQPQIDRILAFLATKGKNNDETIANMNRFFGVKPDNG